jgi:uncharacterized protein (DUF2132 family)
VLPITKLIALKAFYLGRKIAESNKSYLAEPVIEKALSVLSKNPDPADKRREVFYLLLMAEIHRGKVDAVTFRERARNLDKECELGIYQLYMKVVDATQTRVNAAGISGSVISSPEIRNERGVTFNQDFWGGPMSSWDFAIASLDLDDRSLSDRDIRFLHKTTLAEILRKHNLD